MVIPIINQQLYSQLVHISSSEIDSFAIALESLKGFKFIHIMNIRGDSYTSQCQNTKLTSELDKKYFSSENIRNDDAIWYEFLLCNFDLEATFVLFKVHHDNINKVKNSGKNFFLHVAIKAFFKLDPFCKSRICNGSYNRFTDITDIDDITGKCGTFKVLSCDRDDFLSQVDNIMRTNNVLNAEKNLVFFYRFQHSMRDERIPEILNTISGESNFLDDVINLEVCRKRNLVACFQIHYAVNYCSKFNGAIFMNKANVDSTLKRDRHSSIVYYRKFGLNNLCHFSCYAGINGGIDNVTYVQTYSNHENRIRNARNLSFLGFKLLSGYVPIDMEPSERISETLIDLRIEAMRKYFCIKIFLNEIKDNFDLRLEIVLTSTDAQGPQKLLDMHFPHIGDLRSDVYLRKKLTKLLIDKECFVVIDNNEWKEFVLKVIEPKFEVIRNSYEIVENFDLVSQELTKQNTSGDENKDKLLSSLMNYLVNAKNSIPSKQHLMQLYESEVGLRYILSGSTNGLDNAVLKNLKVAEPLNKNTLLEATHLSPFSINEYETRRIEAEYNKVMDDFPNKYYLRGLLSILWFCDSSHSRIMNSFCNMIDILRSQKGIVQSVVLQSTKKYMIFQQMTCFLILLAHHCSQYNGLKNVKVKNILDYFLEKNIPKYNREKKIRSMLRQNVDEEKLPTVDKVVKCLLCKPNRAYLIQFCRALCIPTSYTEEKSQSDYENICVIYQEVLKNLIELKVEVIPHVLIDSTQIDTYEWIKISKM